jgi:hypothetical protein
MKNEIKKSEILFLTTTIGTKWIFYQQFLLNKLFPESKRMLIDGNTGWDFNKGTDCVWYDFLKLAVAHKDKFKYFVHIDEDCFITDADGILEGIAILENENYDLIGPADVVPKIRGENPKALNSFFMIGKIETLDKVMAGYEIDLTFNELHITIDPPIEEYKKEYEPYYEFFWNYYKKGFKIANLATSFDEKYKCTGLLKRDGSVFGYHMWYTRDWGSNTPIFETTQYARYKKMGQYLKSTFHISGVSLFTSLPSDLKMKYFSITYSRLVTKNINRVVRRLKKSK